MQYLFGALIFLFGAAAGSFVLVIAERYNTGLPFLSGRSVCFFCNNKLTAKDLFPVFSFVFLKGRCGYCGGKIPLNSFFAEILMGGFSILAALKSGFLSLEPGGLRLEAGISYLIITAIFAAIFLISLYDLKHFIIPDSFLIFLFIFSFAHVLISELSIFQSFISAVVLALPFLLLFLVSKGKWMGFGDVKYILVLGFFLGPVLGLSAIVLSFWIGAAFSLTALLLKHFGAQKNLPAFLNNLTIKSEVPFGPFLSLGAVASFCLNADLFQISHLFNVF